MKHLLSGGCFSLLIFISGCANNDPAVNRQPGNIPGNSGQGTDSPLPLSSSQSNAFTYKSSKQYIYLSFDDGPQRGTKETIALCRELGVKASYFMIGVHVTGRNDGKKIIAAIKQSYPGFLLANHSYRHASGRYDSFYHHSSLALKDFLRTQDTLGISDKIIRLPGNNAWLLKDTMRSSWLTRPLCRKLDSAGYIVIGWDTEWMFNHKNARPLQSAENMAGHIKNLLDSNQTFTRNHLVLLTHDRIFQRPADLDSLRKMIRILQRNPGYIFETVDHYPGQKR